MATIFDYLMNSSAKTPPGKKVEIKTTENILTPQLGSNMGKQIMENMESVMKTLKKRKKHQKHKQKNATKVQSGNPGSEDESLAKLKENWIRVRPKDTNTDGHSSGAAQNSDKKNAFQMLMLNGGKGKDESSSAPEDNPKKPSPDVGKRKLSSGVKTQSSIKRRKLKSAIGDVVQANSEQFQSPVKKRRKKKLFECHVETVDYQKPVPDSPVVIDDSANEDTLTPSRPRRSCAANVTYTETSPVSSKRPVPVGTPAEERIKRTTRAKPAEVPERPSIPVIDLEEGKSPEVKKFAPLFMKALPKPTIDAKVLEARQSFLKSDMPEKMRQEIDKKKSVQEEIKYRQLNLFPEISHVTQNGEDTVYLNSYNEDQLFPKREPQEAYAPATYCIPRSPTKAIIEYPREVFSPIKSESKKKDLVRSLKANNTGTFPAYLFYKMLSKKAKTSAASNVLCTEKFKPSLSNEFVFNLSVINELKELLMDFLTSDDDRSNYETDDEDSISVDAFGMGTKPTIVLSGPCSTGKTSAVYAIANELKYNVIEINASSKRNGSRMLQQLLEATQSHKVPTAKMALNKKILRRLEREQKKMSIIFIEDVDVAFAEDSGFLAAITQLMSMTKRPIILTTNNRNSPNLKKTFEGNQHFKFLEFQRPESVDACVQYLYILGLVEGCNFSLDYLQSMFDFVDRDLRQALFQLDFIMATKGIPVKWDSPTSQRRVELPSFSYETNEDYDIETKETAAQDALNELAKTLDSLCMADTWMRTDCPAMEEEVRELCSLGGGLLKRSYEESSPMEIGNAESSSILNYLSKNQPRFTKSLSTDVEPTLRQICRSERERKETQRATSRFSHYLLREPSLDYCLAMFGTDRSTKEDVEFLNQSGCVFSM